MPPIGETAYDLKFSLLGIPVRVHPAFWVVGCLLGWVDGRLDLVFVWLASMFVSILVHEFGHALSARHFGWPPHVVLYHFGGVAIFTPGHGYTRGRSIWITFAGPLAGFVLFGIVVAVDFAVSRDAVREGPWLPMLFNRHPPQSPADWAILPLEWINLAWGLFNLLPVHPLDGGKICSELLNARGSSSGRIRTHQIGMVAAALAALFFINFGMFIGGLMFAGLAYENYRNFERLKRGFW